ncbi:MAG: F0F1 ATP synthase subunit delta [Mixta calida]|nr:F0F1 ATP synthase subunit delta [Mixta calida]
MLAHAVVKQRDALAEKLARIYGHEMSIHTEVDTSLLGGMVIRVGDEVIDGSTAGKLRRLRVNLG